MIIAAFGFRSIPPSEGSAGADKFALELYTRMVNKGHQVIAYNRIYNQKIYEKETEYCGIKIINLKTVRHSGFDTLIHSLKATFHILIHKTADIIHIHNGGNSIWCIFLKLFGKKVFVSQDGIDWKRDKWSWYAKLFLYASSFITAHIPNHVIFDNTFARDAYEKKYKRKYNFIPYGCELRDFKEDMKILDKLNVEPKEYFLFVGRFIPDKGLHYLISAFKKVNTSKKLVLVGGSPNPSDYELRIKNAEDKRIIFPGYIYGDDANTLIKNAYCYIQPSDVEGLSPVILTVMGLNVPLICSDIKENIFIVEDTATLFHKGSVDSLRQKIEYTLSSEREISVNAIRAKERVSRTFNWEKVADEHIQLFIESKRNKLIK